MGWLQDLISGIGDAISGALSSTWNGISDSIWGKFMSFIYSMVYEALADFFTLMTEIGANLFDLGWVKAALHFFNLFGWGLFVAGLIVAIFDTAIEYQTMGRLNIKKQILQLGQTDMAEEYINRIIATLEKHMIESEKENKSQILYSTTLRNAVPTEQICQKLLQNMVNIPEFEQFKDEISALQSRYEEYISQTRGEPNEN